MLTSIFSNLSKTLFTMAAFGVMLMLPNESYAQNLECRNLASQISAASRGGNSTQYNKYSRAVNAQNAQLKKLTSQIRSARCSSGSFIFGSGNSNQQCAQLNGTLKKMRSNLSALTRKRDSYSGGNNGKKQLLEAKFRQRGCNTQLAPVTTVRLDKGTTAPKAGIAREIGRAKKPNVPGLNYGGETFRTLCVRTCDGYYFPISFSTTQSNFGRDQNACSAMCPGTDAQLFIHRVPEEESEDMISVAGEPYKALPNAFVYRKQGTSPDKACSCGGSRNFIAVNRNFSEQGATSLEDLKAQAEAQTEPSYAPSPTLRPTLRQDIETVMNKAGNFDPSEARKILKGDAFNVAKSGEDAPIRVVGPVFLPDQAGAIDLQSPVQPLIR